MKTTFLSLFLLSSIYCVADLSKHLHSNFEDAAKNSAIKNESVGNTRLLFQKTNEKAELKTNTIATTRNR